MRKVVVKAKIKIVYQVIKKIIKIFNNEEQNLKILYE